MAEDVDGGDASELVDCSGPSSLEVACASSDECSNDDGATVLEGAALSEEALESTLLITVTDVAIADPLPLAEAEGESVGSALLALID